MNNYEDDPRAYWATRGLTYRQTEKDAQYFESISHQQAKYLLHFIGGPRILELGCGYGRILYALESILMHAVGQQRKWQLYGVDFSESQLQSRALGAHFTHFVCADGLHLPFADESMDTVFTMGCLMHIPPLLIEDVLRECRRVSKTRCVHVEEEHEYLEDHSYAHDYERLYGRTGLPKSVPMRSMMPHLIEPQQSLVIETYYWR